MAVDTAKVENIEHRASQKCIVGIHQNCLSQGGPGDIQRTKLMLDTAYLAVATVTLGKCLSRALHSPKSAVDSRATALTNP